MPGTHEERWVGSSRSSVCRGSRCQLADLSSPVLCTADDAGRLCGAWLRRCPGVRRWRCLAGRSVVEGVPRCMRMPSTDREASIASRVCARRRRLDLDAAAGRTVSVTDHRSLPRPDGSMSGLRVTSSRAGRGIWRRQRLLQFTLPIAANSEGFTSIVSVDGLPAFCACESTACRTYICASTAVVDIDAPVGQQLLRRQSSLSVGRATGDVHHLGISRRDVAPARARRVPDHRRPAVQEPLWVL